VTRQVIWTVRAGCAAAAALGAWYYLRAERRLAGGYGFPLDDPYIHLQFARNVAAGDGFSFNAGEPSAGSTSPLWTWLLAAMLRAGGDPVLGAKILGILLLIFTAWLAVDLARILTRSSLAAAVAGLGVALSPRLTWGSVSGMEVPLYTALSVLAIVRYLEPAGRWRGDWGFWAGLSGAARPETFLLFPILAAHRTWQRRGATDRRQPALLRDRELQVATLAFLVVCAAFVLHNLRAGSLLPTTFAAKSGGAGILHLLAGGDGGAALRLALRSMVEEPNVLARFVYDQSALMFALLLPGGLALAGLIPKLGWPAGGGVLVACCLVMPAAMGAVSPGPFLLLQEGRYVAHLLVLAFVIGAAGLAALQQVTRRPVVVVVIALVMLARLASQDVKFAPRHAAMVDNILRQQVAVGQWIADQRHRRHRLGVTPPDRGHRGAGDPRDCPLQAGRADARVPGAGPARSAGDLSGVVSRAGGQWGPVPGGPSQPRPTGERRQRHAGDLRDALDARTGV
jgi:hypothetical protein